MSDSLDKKKNDEIKTVNCTPEYGKANGGRTAIICSVLLGTAAVCLIVCTAALIVSLKNREVWNVLLIILAGLTCSAFPIAGMTGFVCLTRGELKKERIRVWLTWKFYLSIVLAVLFVLLTITVMIMASILNDPAGEMSVNDVRDFLGERAFGFTGLDRYKVNTVAAGFCAALVSFAVLSVVFAVLNAKTAVYYDEAALAVAPDIFVSGSGEKAEYYEYYLGEPPSAACFVTGIAKVIIGILVFAGTAILGRAVNTVMIMLLAAILSEGICTVVFEKILILLRRRADEILDAEEAQTQQGKKCND